MRNRKSLLRACDTIPVDFRDIRKPLRGVSSTKKSSCCQRKKHSVMNVVYQIEDSSFLRFMKKWYKYGKNAKLLKGTEYVAFIRGRRTRPGLTLAEKIKLLVPALIKGIPFAIGYYF